MLDRDLYRFVTNWRVHAPCEEVSDVLEDTDRISVWWPSVYHECTILERGGEHALGRRVAVTTKGFLPYLIRWRFTVVAQNYPHGSQIVADGDLEGEGRWTLRQDGDDTAVNYEWNVRANHPFIRRFSWLLRPLFAANHNWTMQQGLRGLRQELAGRERGQPSPS
jgi:Polyketide cyclase / dehydrase and lipid transport